MKKIIDAVINGEKKYAGKAYFFKGDQYLRYDWNSDRMDSGYPLPIAGNWPGLPDSFARGIDAAINGEKKYAGKAYFFKGDQYLRYDWNSDRMDSGYPLPIAGNWPGLPDSFSRGFDAAINGEKKYAGKAYFFKGDQYLRYDWNSDRMDSGYPLPIAGNWPGLPDSFARGIDAAINGEKKYAGKAYFFKGDQYLRYDWNSDGMDSGYPLPIAGNWPGLMESEYREPDLNLLHNYGSGSFASFVASNRLDSDIACLLDFMRTKSKPNLWMSDSADAIHHDLTNGLLVGIQKAAMRHLLLPYADPRFHPEIMRASVGAGGAQYAPMRGMQPTRGWILAGDNFMPPNVALWFQILVLPHEFNHHRARDVAGIMETEAAGEPGNANQYVDPALAARYSPGVKHTRTQYVVEIVARHVAWHVLQEYNTRFARKQALELPTPLPGRLFSRCVAFAADEPAAYHDNGYMMQLKNRGMAVLGRQVALWLQNVPRYLLCGNPALNLAATGAFNVELALAQAAGWLPGSEKDGLA